MRSPIGVIIFVLFCVILDWYVFSSVKTVSMSYGQKTRTWISIVYWSISVTSAVFFLSLPFLHQRVLGKLAKNYFFSILIGLFIAKLVSIVFFAADDLRRFFQWSYLRVFTSSAKAGIAAPIEEELTIPRSVFMSWLGIGLGSTLFGSLLYGFTNKYNYQIVKLKLNFPNLPVSFNGLKIIQISDIHCGSFTDKKSVERGVEKIMQLQPDLILFTGDLVNNMAAEMEDYVDVFDKLKAPMGVYSVLGNHDYGDYVQWPVDGLSKAQNLENLKKIHEQMGWRLLMNEHVVLEKGNDQIALIGIENWGAKARFPKYGRMDLAYENTAKYPFKILLSHDPSHWDAEVLVHYKDIDLTLSGHTHGMQFGVEIPGFKWSPVQYMYKNWAGLYQSGNQYLYVNRGFGFLGYPGRVGVLPEITFLELNC